MMTLLEDSDAAEYYQDVELLPIDGADSKKRSTSIHLSMASKERRHYGEAYLQANKRVEGGKM